MMNFDIKEKGKKKVDCALFSPPPKRFLKPITIIYFTPKK